MNWIEDDFKVLPNAVVSSIHSKLIGERTPIEKRAGLRVSTVLSNYIKIVREKALAYDERETTLSIETVETENTAKQIIRGVKLSRLSGLSSKTSGDSRFSGNAKPGDVSKLSSFDSKYQGAPAKQIRKRYRIF